MYVRWHFVVLELSSVIGSHGPGARSLINTEVDKWISMFKKAFIHDRHAHCDALFAIRSAANRLAAWVAVYNWGRATCRSVKQPWLVVE